MIAWSHRLQLESKNWEESELLDFVDELQMRTYFLQKEIEENFVESDNSNDTTVLD